MKSTALKLLTGNAGKRPVNLDKFSPAAAIPRCPAHITGEARKEWKRITAELDACRMIAAVDRGELAMLCTAWARYVEAEEMIEKASRGGGTGLFVKTPNGFAVQSPWLAVSNSAMRDYRALASDFGLSPAARIRLAPQTTQLSLPGLEMVGQKPTISSLIR